MNESLINFKIAYGRWDEDAIRYYSHQRNYMQLLLQGKRPDFEILNYEYENVFNNAMVYKADAISVFMKRINILSDKQIYHLYNFIRENHDEHYKSIKNYIDHYRYHVDCYRKYIGMCRPIRYLE